MSQTSNIDGVRLQKLIDTTSTANVIYICKAEFGTATSAAEWYIEEINTSDPITIKSASNAFDQIADDRTSLTYT
jgi:hypothetical protein